MWTESKIFFSAKTFYISNSLGTHRKLNFELFLNGSVYKMSMILGIYNNFKIISFFPADEVVFVYIYCFVKVVFNF